MLLLQRLKPPNKSLWNGLGGKLESCESPEECIIREMQEEAGIDITQHKLSYKGVVTWSDPTDVTVNGGMHVYLCYLDRLAVVPQVIPEGTLDWHDISWAVDIDNNQVSSNIPHFLPLMLASSNKHTYACTYIKDTFQTMTVMSFDEK